MNKNKEVSFSQVVSAKDEAKAVLAKEFVDQTSSELSEYQKTLLTWYSIRISILIQNVIESSEVLNSKVFTEEYLFIRKEYEACLQRINECDHAVDNKQLKEEIAFLNELKNREKSIFLKRINKFYNEHGKLKNALKSFSHEFSNTIQKSLHRERFFSEIQKGERLANDVMKHVVEANPKKETYVPNKPALDNSTEERLQ